jgi:carbon-monoxide dehydrogenase medium subunit
MGTIGGSLAHSDPTADLPPVMLVLSAEMTATGPRGSRTIKAADFFVDLLTSALAPNEVLTQIRIPIPKAGMGGAYEKFPHPASRYAMVGVAAVVGVGGGKIQNAQVALTGLTTKATRASGVEQALVGQAANAQTIEAASKRAAEGIDVRGDLQGSEEYKRNLAATYARRALTRAVERAGRGA